MFLLPLVFGFDFLSGALGDVLTGLGVFMNAWGLGVAASATRFEALGRGQDLKVIRRTKAVSRNVGSKLGLLPRPEVHAAEGRGSGTIAMHGSVEATGIVLTGDPVDDRLRKLEAALEEHRRSTSREVARVDAKAASTAEELTELTTRVANTEEKDNELSLSVLNREANGFLLVGGGTLFAGVAQLFGG